MNAKFLFLTAAVIALITWGTVDVYQRGKTQASPRVEAGLTASASAPVADAKSTFVFRSALEQALTLPVETRRQAVVDCFEHAGLEVNFEDGAWVLQLYLADVLQGYPRVRQKDWLGYFQKLVQLDARQSAEFLLQHERLVGAGMDREGSLLMSLWAGMRPREAMDWGRTGEEQLDWLRRNGRELAEAWSALDLQDLLNYVSEGGREPSEWTTIDALAKQRGRDAVEQWLEANSDTSSTLPEGIRIAAVNRIVTQKLNDLGPAEAAAWVGKRTRPEELIAGVTEVAPAYARKEPERAMTWLEKFSATPGFHHRSGEVAMLEYATRDLAGAGEWLNAHLDSPIVSAYIWGYAVQVALEDPEAAAAWAAKLPTTGGWGNTAPGANPWTSMEDVMEGGRTPKTLAMNIQAAARAGQLYRNPETPLPPWEGDPPPHFLRYENPILVKSSPDTEPVLQMKIHPEGGCHAISHGTWTLPFPTYIQQADGSLTLEPTGTQVSR